MVVMSHLSACRPISPGTGPPERRPAFGNRQGTSQRLTSSRLPTGRLSVQGPGGTHMDQSSMLLRDQKDFHSAPDTEFRVGMSRYDLTDFEWRVIEPLLPNKPRGVSRVDHRRVLNGIFWVLRSGAPCRPAGALWPAHHLLQPLPAMAKGWRLGPADGRHRRRARR